jgi:hypothetical protein
LASFCFTDAFLHPNSRSLCRASHTPTLTQFSLPTLPQPPFYIRYLQSRTDPAGTTLCI